MYITRSCSCVYTQNRTGNVLCISTDSESFPFRRMASQGDAKASAKALTVLGLGSGHLVSRSLAWHSRSWSNTLELLSACS